MDKKPLSERVKDAALMANATTGRVGEISVKALLDMCIEIADLERRLEETEDAFYETGKILAEESFALGDMHSMWLDAVAKYVVEYTCHGRAWEEAIQLRAELTELKENNGLNRAEVEVERLLKVVAEKDALLEEQKQRIEALMIGVEEHTGKQGTTPVLTYISRLEAEIERLRAGEQE